jgi:hypothetical protein
MDFKSNLAAHQAGLNHRTPLRSLGLVKPRKPRTYNRTPWSIGPAFSASEMRHNFAIWTLERSGASLRHTHVYYCLRCKWTFQVNDSSGTVIPLDQNGLPIEEHEATERLATFGYGPCPVFSRLLGSTRQTKVIPPKEAFRVRLTAMFHEFGRIWKPLRMERSTN